METLPYTRANDLPPTQAERPSAASVDPSALVGAWVSTNRATCGIVKLILAHKDGRFTVQAFGALPDVANDWGEAEAFAFAGGVEVHDGVGFKAFYDFGFMETALAAYLNKRILVVDSYNTFKDGSGRRNYFSRDHFYQEEAAP